MPGMVTLQVYIAETCWVCAEAQRIVADVAPRFPEVKIELLDLNKVERPAAVFAAPTYVLNGRVIFLGNPTRQQLQQKLAAVHQAVDL